MAGTEVSPGTDFVTELYHRGLEAIPNGPMPLEVYEEHHNPKQFHGHLAVNSYLPANCRSVDSVDRMTGRLADMAVPTGSSSLTGNHESMHLTAVDLRAAPGSVFLDFAKQLHKNSGGKKPWFFSELDGAVQLFERKYRKSDKSTQWHSLASIGDDHPINELPVITNQGINGSTITQEVSFGCPPNIVELAWSEMQRTGVNYDKVRDGLEVHARVLSEHVAHPSRLPGKKVRQDSIDNWNLLPQRKDLVNYVWRAFGMAKYMEGNGFPGALDDKSMAGMIMGTMAYARALQSVERTGSLAAAIGILDIKDASMMSLVEQLVGDDTDLSDPEIRSKLHGSLYIRESNQSQLEAPILYSNGNGQRRPVEGRFKLFLNSHDKQSPYLGFQTMQEVEDEFANRTRVKGATKAPVASFFHFPRNITGSGDSYGVDVLAVDPIRSLGAFMEAFIRTAPWVANYITPQNMDFTVEDVLRGKFEGATRGTAAEALALCAYGLLSRSGDTRDDSGARKGYKIVEPLERGRAAAINVSWPEQDEAVTITTGGLRPEKPVTMPALTRRRKLRKAGQLVIGNGMSEPQLDFDRLDGQHEVVSMISDGGHNLYISGYKSAFNEELPDDIPPVPVPTVIVNGPKIVSRR